MIAVPFSQGRPSRAASHPCYERLRPDPTPAPRTSSGDLLVRPLPAIRQRDGPSGDCADFLMCARSSAHTAAVRYGWRLLADDHPGHADQIDLCAGVVRIWPMSEHLWTACR